MPHVNKNIRKTKNCTCKIGVIQHHHIPAHTTINHEADASSEYGHKRPYSILPSSLLRSSSISASEPATALNAKIAIAPRTTPNQHNPHNNNTPLFRHSHKQHNSTISLVAEWMVSRRCHHPIIAGAMVTPTASGRSHQRLRPKFHAVARALHDLQLPHNATALATAFRPRNARPPSFVVLAGVEVTRDMRVVSGGSGDGGRCS